MTTQAEYAAAQLAFADYAWYHQHLKIVHRDERVIVPLRLKYAQRHVYNRIVVARTENRPFRGICLKARQLGISTFVQSFFACEAFTKSGVMAMTLAHEEPAAANLHRMLKQMYDNLPDALRPPTETDQQGKALFLKHGSGIIVRTAGSRESGRSYALTHFHASEAAYYADARRTLLAARATMQYKPGTFEMVEATANGIVDDGQAFHDEWYAAVEGESGYEPFFFPWFFDPDYQMPVPEGMLETLTDEERELQRRHSLSLEQLAWRRWNIANVCGGDVRKFRQENPSTPDEAFLVSGRPFFDAERVEAMPITPPTHRGSWRLPDNAYIGGYTQATRVRWVEASRPGDADHAVIWRLPHPDRKYAVAVDVAGGVEDGEARTFSAIDEAEDYSVITVVDRTTLEVCAQWRDRVDIGLVGFYAAIIGRVYGTHGTNAMLAVEDTGGYGLPVLDVLKRLAYTPQYRREIFDEATRKLTRKLGWATTIATRPKILEGLNDMLREHPERLHSEWLQREMRTFVRGRRPEAAPGHHDDVVLSTAIGLEVAREYPHTQKRAA